MRALDLPRKKAQTRIRAKWRKDLTTQAWAQCLKDNLRLEPMRMGLHADSCLIALLDYVLFENVGM